MGIERSIPVVALGIAVLALAACGAEGAGAGQPAAVAEEAAEPPRDRVIPRADEIGGRVASRDGREAGVWVIAEADDPIGFARIVVTDEDGRFLIPGLPEADYEVWVRGYGLIDSPRVPARPGQTLDLAAVPAPAEAMAVEYYPSGYRNSLPDGPGAEAGLPPAPPRPGGMERNLVISHWKGTDAGDRLPVQDRDEADPTPMLQFPILSSTDAAAGGHSLWVDRFNGLGLGENTPVYPDSQSDALLALDDGEWVTMRVPYPLGFHAKSLYARIDDPEAGWRGRGLWASIRVPAPRQGEGGEAAMSRIYHFQMRPDPLAR